VCDCLPRLSYPRARTLEEAGGPHKQSGALLAALKVHVAVVTHRMQSAEAHGRALHEHSCL
jgi:hypothetical protein